MKTSLMTRLTALFVSVAATLVIIEGMALIGHPVPEAGVEMAIAVQAASATVAR